MEPGEISSSFESLFQRIYESGNNVEKEIDDSLNDKTQRIAFEAFACTHIEVMLQSPLLQRALIRAQNLDSSNGTQEEFFSKKSRSFVEHFMRNKDKPVSPETKEISEFEDLIFNRATKLSSRTLTNRQIDHFEALYRGNLINDEQVVAIFNKLEQCGIDTFDNMAMYRWLAKIAKTKPDLLLKLYSVRKKDDKRLFSSFMRFEPFMTPWLIRVAETNINRCVQLLSDEGFGERSGDPFILTTFSPLLKIIADRDPRGFISLFSKKGEDGLTVLHSASFFAIASPWLQSLAETNPDSLIQLFSVKSRDGDIPLNAFNHVQELLPWLPSLVDRNPDLVAKILLIRNTKGLTLLHDLDKYEENLPLIRRLIEKNPDLYHHFLRIQAHHKRDDLQSKGKLR